MVVQDNTMIINIIAFVNVHSKAREDLLMEQKDYFIGLQIGPESVGWAVTDPAYQLQKCAGKALWGVRLFDAAQKADERREQRRARRRLERKQQRLAWLQEVFSEEIGKVDPAFFLRLQESRFLEKDKQGNLGKHTLFADPSYTDKDYHRAFPTIYHLRKTLMETPGPHDVRLVYLAIHHIMKYRGHGLLGDLTIDAVSLDACLSRLNQYLRDTYDRELSIKDPNLFSHALTNRSISTQEKLMLMTKATATSEDAQLRAIMELLAGKTVSINKLYGADVVSGPQSKLNLKEDLTGLTDAITAELEDGIELIYLVKAVYDWAFLEHLRRGETYLSCAKVKSYEKHNADLLRLKAVIREQGDPALYREIFHTAKDHLDNYVAYSGKDSANYSCDRESFSKYMIKILKKLSQPSAEVERIIRELEQEIQ